MNVCSDKRVIKSVKTTILSIEFIFPKNVFKNRNQLLFNEKSKLFYSWRIENHFKLFFYLLFCPLFNVLYHTDNTFKYIANNSNVDWC